MLKLRFTNKEHGDVWLVEPSVVLGSDNACQVVLKRDGVQPRHADIRIKGDVLQLVNLASDKALTVNGKPVDKQADLHVGDLVLLAGLQLAVVDPKSEAKPLAEAAAASGWAIRANHSALANKIYSINGDTVLGRSNDCDLSFSVTHLSRKHAQLSVVNGQLVVKDLGSANGTFVNGERQQEAKLQHGDELRLDTLSFAVIGPAGESDKTTVRAAFTLPASSIPTAATKPVSVDASMDAGNNHRAAAKEKRVAGTTAFHKAVSASAEAQQEVVKSGVNWVIVAVALLAVAGLAYFMLR